MTRAARSVFLFGFYPAAIGLLHLLTPQVMLRASGMPPTDLLWLRLMGILLIVAATFYILAGRAGLEPFFPWTLYTRLGAGAVLAILVLSGEAPAIALAFWTPDAAGAAWTWWALRADRADRAAAGRIAGEPA